MKTRGEREIAFIVMTYFHPNVDNIETCGNCVRVQDARDFGTTLNIFECVARRVPAALRDVRCHIRECDGERGPTGLLPSSAKEFAPDIAKLLSRGRYQTINPGMKLAFRRKLEPKEHLAFLFRLLKFENFVNF